MEFEAARLFDRTASTETLLELYDKAIEERGGGSPGSAATLEKRAALARRKDELELERKGYLRQNARGKLSDGDLDAMLAEVDEQREATRAELRAVEDEAEALRRMEVARGSLAQAGFATYDPVYAEWYEDTDATQPDEVLDLAASPEGRRRAYRRYGARFEVDREGTLTLQLSLGVDGEALHIGNSPWSFINLKSINLDSRNFALRGF